MGLEIRPFLLEVPETQLADLRQRLRQTRWPEAEPVSDWSQGVPLAYLREQSGLHFDPEILEEFLAMIIEESAPKALRKSCAK